MRILRCFEGCNALNRSRKLHRIICIMGIFEHRYNLLLPCLYLKLVLLFTANGILPQLKTYVNNRLIFRKALNYTHVFVLEFSTFPYSQITAVVILTGTDAGKSRESSCQFLASKIFLRKNEKKSGSKYGISTVGLGLVTSDLVVQHSVLLCGRTYLYIGANDPAMIPCSLGTKSMLLYSAQTKLLYFVNLVVYRM